MPSPFPGMDPYLENPEVWPNAHARLIADIQETLNARIRPKYFAWIESRIYLSDELDPGRRVLIPDVRVSGFSQQSMPPRSTANSSTSTAVLDVAEPIEVLDLIDDEITESQLQIFDAEHRRLVTVIELLSPANKIAGSSGRESYLRKRKELLQSPVQWVEIDLLRDGQRILGGAVYPTCDYTVYVSWARNRPRAKIWPIFLRQRLPVIPVPLLDPDADAQLDLGAVLNTAYDKSAFDVSINYRSNPIPPLSAEDAAWADSLLREKGLR